MRFHNCLPLALVTACALGAVTARAAGPVGDSAVFLDGAQTIPLRNGSASIYQDAHGRARTADPVCVQDRNGRVLRGALPNSCPAGSSRGYVDRASGKLASKDRGLSEFTQYHLAHSLPAPMIDFQDADGQRKTAVIVVQDGGGSGQFYSLGVVSGVGQSPHGSELVALGDRVIPYWMVFDARETVLSVPTSTAPRARP